MALDRQALNGLALLELGHDTHQFTPGAEA